MLRQAIAQDPTFMSVVNTLGVIYRRHGDIAHSEAVFRHVLAQEPANQTAVELQQKAQTCPPAVVAKAPSPPPPPKVVQIPPDRGGLDLIAGESEKDYTARVKAMRTRYDEALALVNGSPARAIPLLEGIAREAGTRYLEVSTKLGEARKGVAGQALTEARDAEAKNDYDQAIAGFRRAGTLDRDTHVDEDIKRVQDKKLQAGLKACDEGKNAFAFNRGQQALQYYQQVVKLLPESHPCFATAKERIATLSR